MTNYDMIAEHYGAEGVTVFASEACIQMSRCVIDDARDGKQDRDRILSALATVKVAGDLVAKEYGIKATEINNEAVLVAKELLRRIPRKEEDKHALEGGDGKKAGRSLLSMLQAKWRQSRA